MVTVSNAGCCMAGSTGKSLLSSIKRDVANALPSGCSSRHPLSSLRSLASFSSLIIAVA